MQEVYRTDIIRPLSLAEMVERWARRMGVSEDEAARRMLGGEVYQEWKSNREVEGEGKEVEFV